MILIDAIYINETGGLVLLDKIIDVIKQSHSGEEVIFLLDVRVKKYANNKIINGKTFFLESSEFARYNYYRRRRNIFRKIFCFANVPPPVRMRGVVFTYFQNALIIDKQAQNLFPLKSRLLLRLKKYIIVTRLRNTNHIIVQTAYIKTLLVKELCLNEGKVLVIPFYTSEKVACGTKNNSANGKFFYPAAGYHHKNHDLLLNAWINLERTSNFKGELHLTVGQSFEILSNRISRLQNHGHAIVNHGLISKDRANELYAECDYVIHPSLCESFGLVLIEAIENNCILLASDLPYVKSVVIPNYFFNARDSRSMEKSIVEASNRINSLDSKILTANRINELMQLITD